MKRCSICQQKADLYTTVHKKEPFVDGRNYEFVCFTCYFVPKILEQKYAPDGSVAEDIELPYSCEHLCSPKELCDSGAADSVRYAKTCVEAVQKVCSKSLKSKGVRKRPKASWNLS